MIYQLKTCCIALFLFSSCVVAQPLYKSVNEQGEVTFSNRPLPNAVDVEEIQVQAGPTEDQQRESAERIKRIESQANELGAANTERTQQRKDAQQQDKDKDVQPLKGYNDGYNYRNRPAYPPGTRPRPEHPINSGGPGRPVPLPTAPISPPGR